MKLRSTVRATGLVPAMAALILVPIPAMAREHRARESLAETADKLSDPALQGALANALGSLTGAIMSIRMAPFARAVEGIGGHDDGEPIDPDATLGDLMGPDASDMPREFSEGVPRMMNGMAGMAGAFGEMLPQLEAVGKNLQRSLPRR